MVHVAVEHLSEVSFSRVCHNLSKEKGELVLLSGLQYFLHVSNYVLPKDLHVFLSGSKPYPGLQLHL